MPKPNTDHWFIGDDGALYDTTRPDWTDHPLRINYSKQHREIETTRDLLATLRAGEFAWPGGYQLLFLTDDGEALSFDTVRNELRNILDSIKTHAHDGWRVVATFINWEDSDLIDGHTSEILKPEYD